VVAPDKVAVVGPAPGHVLTLTTCHPKGSARQRLVLRADLVDSRRHDAQGGSVALAVR
jgi:sortase A